MSVIKIFAFLFLIYFYCCFFYIKLKYIHFFLFLNALIAYLQCVKRSSAKLSLQ